MLIKSLGKTILDQPSKQENTLALKTSLSHLPEGKQHELAVIKEIILSHEFPRSIQDDNGTFVMSSLVLSAAKGWRDIPA